MNTFSVAEIACAGLIAMMAGRLQITERAEYNARLGGSIDDFIYAALRPRPPFEGWFRDGDGFEAQQKAGEISCPECGETKVEKAVMAPRLGKPLRRFRRLALGLGVAEDPGGGS